MEPDVPELNFHKAVRVQNSIVVIEGELISQAERIWIYNLYTNEWAKYTFPKETELPPKGLTRFTCAVAVGTSIYLFGGGYSTEANNNNDWHITNALWKLSARADGCFYWNKIHIKEKKKRPSPRENHSAWEYDGKLWAFGGYGPSPNNYLKEHGEFVRTVRTFHYYNNQLLCFDPSCQKWSNPRQSGAAPSPRKAFTTAIIDNKVWLSGGSIVISLI